MTWNYSNTSVQTTLSAPVSAGDTIISLGTTAGLPVSYPYTLILDYGAATVEVVTVTAPSGGNLTVTRGQDGTSAQSHSAGAVVVHGVVARDVAEPQAHIAASSNIHGVGGPSAVVGTATVQTLTNKIIDAASNTLSNIPSSAITSLVAAKITQPFATLSVTPASASTTAMTVTANEASRSVPVATFTAQNNAVLIDEDGTLDVDRGDLSVDVARAHLAATSASRLWVKATGKPGLIVKKANSADTYDLLQLRRDDDSVWTWVDSSGRLTSRILIAKPVSGDTGNLLECKNSSNTVLAKVDKDGNVSGVAGTFTGAVATGALTVTGAASISGATTATGDIGAGADINVTGNVNTTGETWHGLTLANNFTNRGAGYPNLSYRKVPSPGNSVQLVGQVLSGVTTTPGTQIATLPVGYRPATEIPISVQAGSSAVIGLAVGTDGSIKVYGTWSNGMAFGINGIIPLNL